jgi:hypothetical protein
MVRVCVPTLHDALQTDQAEDGCQVGQANELHEATVAGFEPEQRLSGSGVAVFTLSVE